ncbi:Tripeptidyl aminopeptidase [Thermoflexales bacterium]|nr:Tripeptidyl aminopeptidase [Thermoflexales bacterium]
MTIRKFVLCSVLLALVLSACNAQPSPTPPPAPAGAANLEKTECWFKEPPGQDVECSWVSVPEDHAKPDGKTIRLAVARFKSDASQPAPDPVIYLEGGPGGSALKSYINQFAFFFGPLLEKRDVILFDQRGTGYSEPALSCPEFKQAVFDMLPQDLTVAESEALANQALLACHKRLVKEGVNLEVYNSAQNAADIEALRQALGYDQINLYGISYGTRLALTAMRDAPAKLRSVIIDSVYTPQVDLYSQIFVNGQRAFEAVFKTCEAEPSCAENYPALRQTFFDLKAKLDKEPITFTATLNSGEKHEVLLNGDGLMGLMFQSLYASSIIPLLPRLIYDLRDGNTDLAAGLEGEFLGQYDKISVGMQHAVQCKEELPFVTQADIEGAMQQHPDYVQLGSKGIIELCQAWGLTPADVKENQAVTSDVPTLVVSGEFDPITPPNWAEDAAKTLSKSFYFNVPRAGHGPTISEECPRSILVAFLDQPTQQPDTACLAALKEGKFAVPLKAADIKLISVTEKQMGFSGVVPDGWQAISAGAYSPSGKMTDNTALMQQAAPIPPESLLQLLQSQFESSEVKVEFEKTATRSAHGINWDIYSTSISIANVNLAVGTQDNMTYFILLQAPKNDHEVLYEAVFLPAIDALEPLK